MLRQKQDRLRIEHSLIHKFQFVKEEHCVGVLWKSYHSHFFGWNIVLAHVVTCDAVLAFSKDKNESCHSIPRTEWNEILKNILGAQLKRRVFLQRGGGKVKVKQDNHRVILIYCFTSSEFVCVCLCVCRIGNIKACNSTCIWGFNQSLKVLIFLNVSNNW